MSRMKFVALGVSVGDVAGVSTARLVVSMISRFPRIGRAREVETAQPPKAYFTVFGGQIGCASSAYCSFTNATPYPFNVTWMGELGAMLEAVGPMVASVAASMVNRFAVLNVPRLLRSSDTVRGAPGPLLSVGDATAWLATITTTLLSSLRTARVSRSVISLLLK